MDTSQIRHARVKFACAINAGAHYVPDGLRDSNATGRMSEGVLENRTFDEIGIGESASLTRTFSLRMWISSR